MKNKLFWTFILLFGFVFGLKAQDVIVKKNGTRLKVIVKEINDVQIKYVDYNDPDGVVFTIDKVLVREIKFHTGNKVKMKDPEENVWYYADDKINNLMLHFSAFGSNTLGLSYERALVPGQSIFGELKFYGIGMVNEDFIRNRSGFGLQLSYRFKVKSLFKKSNEYRPRHVLHGGYFAPTLGFSSGSYESSGWFFDQTEFTKYNHTLFLFGLEYGKEWILQKTLSIDISAGFYYYGGSDDGALVRMGNIWGSDNKLFSFNIRVGFLFGQDRLTDKRAASGTGYNGKQAGGKKFFE